MQILVSTAAIVELQLNNKIMKNKCVEYDNNKKQ